jgi:prevent-host-death family protein
MSAHNIAEAGANLTDLIDRAIAGEAVVITRNGKPVAELNAVRPPREPRRVTAEDIAWLDANRVGTVAPDEDAVTLIRRLREEGDSE